MNVRSLPFALASALLVGSACAPAGPPAPPPANTAQDRADIEAIIDGYEQALNNSDLDAAVGMYAADAVFMPNNDAAQRGIDAIRAYYQNTTLQNTFQTVFTVAEVEIDGDLAWATTAMTGTQVTADGTEVQILSKGLFVFRREPSGGPWHVVGYMFNAAAP